MGTRNTSKSHGAWLFLALAFGAFPGCGPEDETKFDASDPGKLQALVLNVNDAKSRDLKKFSELFAGSAQPAEKDRTAMKGLSFKLAPGEQPVIEADKATMKVLVRQGETEKATATWTAVKEGTTWKLTATPLQ